MSAYSYPKEKIKVLLLEGVHQSAVQCFEEAGYKPKLEKKAFTEDELLEVISEVHVLGIRSKTELTAKVFEKAKRLLAVGCYCIGTNQVNLDAARKNGVAVFNSPFSNTRSVAELTMAEVIMLSRKAAHLSANLHRAKWEKTASGCYEVRNKTIGIVGYGHIGQQVGILAEGLGMKVVFFDILKKLPLGNAQALKTLDDVLKGSDFVTLHVPETPQTKGMIGKKELGRMKKGSYLLNLSRGTVVNLSALADAIKSKHIAGAGIDVYPVEPVSNDQPFECDLCGLENVILTPHIGGSTQEAQQNIGIEVSVSLIKYTDNGASLGSVNFPELDLPLLEDSHRVMNIHQNVPGVLGNINGIIANLGANIRAQFLRTYDDVGYLIMDVDKSLSKKVKQQIDELSTTIKTRLLF